MVCGRGSKLPRHCHPLWEKDTISLREILLIGSREGCDPLELSRGAEGTDSPPHHPFSYSAEILRISGRGICKEAIFSPGSRLPSEKISTRGDQPKSSISLGRSRSDLLALWASNLSAAQVAGLDWKSRGLRPSRALPEYSDEDFGSRRCEAWGALLPYTPLGDGMREGSHPLALSRGCSVGGFGLRRNRRAAGFCLRHFCFRGGLHENFVPDRTGAQRVAFIGAFAFAAICTKISFLTERVRDALRSSALLLPRRCKRRFRFRRRGAWGALLPYTPSGTGCERVHTLSRSPGAVRSERLVSDETGGRRAWSCGAYLPRLFERCFGFRENARGVPLGTEAGELHIFTARFRRSFSLQRNACTALFRWTGCERSSHPVAPKNGEFMKFID